MVCIRREGQDIEKLISNDEILNEYKVIFVDMLLLCFGGPELLFIIQTSHEAI